MSAPLPKIGDQAKGRWPAILPALGIDKRFLVNRHGPCPMCEGHDRFRFDDKDGRGTWFCNHCGSGDGVLLVQKFCRLEFKEAAREIAKHVGTAPVTAIRQGPDAAAVKAEMASLWKASKPLGEMAATSLWWKARIGLTPQCGDLRANDRVSLGRDHFPAMLAKVRDAAGNWVNLHRTYLSREGTKAPIDDPRRVMPLPLPKGCAVRLSPIAECMGIAEGIETAIAAKLLHDIPTWAALNAGNLEGWTPPEGCGRVVIFGDNDTSATGQAASWSLCKRLRREGYEVTVHLPPFEGEDWNDAYLRETRPQPPETGREAA
jgi:putative DNA primase/helicase